MGRISTPFHDWLVQLRRHFHQIPELSYQEEKTAAKISEVLGELGVPHETGVGRTGIVAALEASRPGPALGLRADMDALPIQEANEVPYRSQHPGVMHACGHDGHVTIVLGVIRRLLEQDWTGRGRGKIRFFFQPAEEGGAGARAMLETGVLDREPLEAIFAGHLHPELPVGDIGLAPGASNAASDTVRIRIMGRGGHGAQPHLCIDPIVAGAYLVTQMQSILSRNVHPMESAVLTVGRFRAGTASNVIPQEARLDGTLRTLKPEVRELIANRLRALVKGLELSHGVSAELHLGAGYPVLVNDPDVVRFIMEEGARLLGTDHVHPEPPRMGAEDFAYFLQKAPGALIRLGCHDPEKGFTYGLHSPYFDMDERALDVGVELFTRLLTTYGTPGEA